MSNDLQEKHIKTISISLQKGGTGKTSLAVSLAAELAREKGSVILVDADPQGNTSAWIGPDLLDYELADVLNSKREVQSALLEKAVIKTTVQNLYLLPTVGLDGGLKAFENDARDNIGCFNPVIKALGDMGFQYCIIDLSPSFGPIEKAALTASGECITPVMPDAFGLDGLQIFASNLKVLRRTLEDIDKDGPTYNRIVINAIDRRIGQHEEIITKMKEYKGDFTLYYLPVDPCFRKAQAAGITIQEMTGAKKDTLSELFKLATDVRG
jgi:chromosome partitioning protein